MNEAFEHLSGKMDTVRVREGTPNISQNSAAVYTEGSIIMLNKINLSQKLSLFNERWNPKIIGVVNHVSIKLVKLKGEFIWHSHAEEDELFLVLKGNLLIQFRDQEVLLKEGELLIIPRGIEHRPIAAEEVHVMLVEPDTTVNTGDVITPKSTTGEWI